MKVFIEADGDAGEGDLTFWKPSPFADPIQLQKAYDMTQEEFDQLSVLRATASQVNSAYQQALLRFLRG